MDITNQYLGKQIQITIIHKHVHTTYNGKILAWDSIGVAVDTLHSNFFFPWNNITQIRFPSEAELNKAE